MADALIGREVLVLTFVAGASAVTANRFITPEDSSGLSVLASADIAAGGVARDDVAIGKVGDKIVIGTAWVLSASNLAAGESVQVGTGGTAKSATTAGIIVGTAVKNTNSGEYAEILLGNAGIF